MAGMAETGVLLDARGEPVVPGIAWYDERGAEHASRLASELGDTFAERVGLPVRPLCTLVKYAWMREHWPESRRGVRWLNVAEWIVRAARRRGGGRVLARLAHRVLRPPHPRAVGGGAGVGRRAGRARA